MNILKFISKPLFPFLLLVLFSCSIEIPKEGEFLKWSTILEIPLLKGEITLETLADDSLISVESLENYFEDGEISDSIFVYRKQIDIEKVVVGNKLEIDPINTSFSQSIDDVTVASIEKIISSKIGTITLTDIDPTSTEPFILSDIYPDILNVSDGESVVIPAFEIDPIINSFSFDDFGYAEFLSGNLQITISNNMVIPLGPPIQIRLLQVLSSDTTNIPGAIIQFDNLINANNGLESGVMDLSGITLPGEILVEVSGNCPGTSGIPIEINQEAKNSSFIVTIGGADMKVISATAKIPQQVIEETGIINLEPDSNKVTKAIIDIGDLVIKVDNYMALSSILNISIPSLLNSNGNQFTSTINITENTIDLNSLTNMNGYSLIMDAEDQSINYSYNIETIDSGEELIQITSDDSIRVQILFSGSENESNITFSSFQGYLNQDAMVDSNSIVLETATKIDEAILSSGTLKLSISNEIGIEAIINFSLEEFTKNGIVLDTSFFISSDPLEILIDLTGYLLDLDINSDQQSVNYISTIDIPSEEEMFLSFGQSILIDINMDSLSFSEIVGYVEPVMVQIDSTEQNIDIPEELEELDFSTIKMQFSFQSSISLPVFLNLELKSYNDQTGESSTRLVNNINITQFPEFSIDSIEQLININPNRIIAFGDAEVGSLDVLGAVSASDSLIGKLTIVAPLAFEINNESKIELDPAEFESISTEDILNANVFMNYENNLELGADVIFLLATDTTYFENGLSDTLTQLVIKPSESGKDSIALDEAALNLLSREGNYSKAILNLLGKDQGPTRFLSTDTIKFNLFLSTEIVVDPNESE